MRNSKMQATVRRYPPGRLPRQGRLRLGGRELLVGLLALGLAGCTSGPTGGAASLAASTRQAIALNRRAIAAADPAEAQRLFAQAVAADPLYGPAHNNLGIVLLKQGEYYAAAQAFERAIRLLPADPAPRTNLGLVYEAAQQFQNAQEQFEQALVVAPEALEAIQALARVRVRISQLDPKTIALLRTIQLRGTEAAWRHWATTELLRAGVGEGPTTAP